MLSISPFAVFVPALVDCRVLKRRMQKSEIFFQNIQVYVSINVYTSINVCQVSGGTPV
jgi:hypothetical protein